MKTLALLIIFSIVSAISEVSLQTTRSKQEGIVINKKGGIFNNAGAKLGYIACASHCFFLQAKKIGSH
jgi:hypothetical protein